MTEIPTGAAAPEAAGSATESTAGPVAEPVRPGRKRDHSRDAVILEATLDVLADTGWEGLTMDLVAQRARAGKATLYRRWPSKNDLILDAVTRLGLDNPGDGSGAGEPPDTGSLLGDILALLHPSEIGERHMKVMAALTSMMLHHVELAEQIDTALHEPWVQANRTAIRRAIDRGEADPHADVETLARVLPAMAAYRILLQHRDLDRDHLTTLVENVLAPALRIAPLTG